MNFSTNSISKGVEEKIASGYRSVKTVEVGCKEIDGIFKSWGMTQD
jgi:hypothetical protein